MKWLTFKSQLEPGFRINLNDMILLFLASAFSFLLYFISTDRGLFILPIYIAFSFFIFCNVFRVTWLQEVFWYVPFIITTIYAIQHVENFWFLILCIFEPFKAILIIMCIKKGPYVGLLYKKVGNHEGYIPANYRERIEKTYKLLRDMVKGYL